MHYFHSTFTDPQRQLHDRYLPFQTIRCQLLLINNMEYRSIQQVLLCLALLSPVCILSSVCLQNSGHATD